MINLNKLFYLLIVLVMAACQKQSNIIEYSDVVNKLIDLKSIALLPQKGEASQMWSSYDRKSQVTENGEFISWAANIDGLEPQYIRKEGDLEVLAEMEGPGYIVRIWSANPRSGKVKVYIDGKEKPVIDLPFIDYFNTKIDAFAFPELVYQTNAQGFNNYVPITYNESCKIVAEKGWGQYYHFNYITFPKGKKIESYSGQLNKEEKESLQNINDFFAQNMGQLPYNNSHTQMITEEVSIAAKEEKRIFKSDNKGAITSIKISLLDQANTNIEEALRKATIEMKWDGKKEAAVWSPLGDFFGTAPGYNLYKTLPMGITRNHMYSYWYMPYEKGAEIIIKNEYTQKIKIKYEVTYEKLNGDIAKFGRFHAKWHRDLDPLEESRWPDWTLLETKGRGRYVGTQLTVWSPKGGSCYLGFPGNWWWGEGDEKFFIDGEKFPSTFGTGTEDYFGYAWCNPARFEHAFHSQSLDNGNMGYQPMNRWHIIDAIPFQESFDGYLEKYFPNEWPTQYSTVVYWYLDKNGIDPLTPVSVEDRYGFETQYEVYRAHNAIEGEAFQVIENTGGWASGNVFANEKLYDRISGHKVIQWAGDKNKDNLLKANFDYPISGNYKVYGNILTHKNGGNFDIKLNGKRLKPIDFSNSAEKEIPKKIYLGTLNLNKGKQELTLQWLQKKNKGNLLKIDCLIFEKI